MTTAAAGSTDVAILPSAAVVDGALPNGAASVTKLEDADSGAAAGGPVADSAAVDVGETPGPASVTAAISNILIECPLSRASTTATGSSGCNARSEIGRASCRERGEISGVGV